MHAYASTAFCTIAIRYLMLNLISSYLTLRLMRTPARFLSLRQILYERWKLMAVSKERKAQLIAQYGKDANDSGSAAVQVALLTERIKGLTEHVKEHKHDFHTRRGLLMLVGKRRNLLGYIKRQDIEAYRSLIKSLGIRDNIQ